MILTSMKGETSDHDSVIYKDLRQENFPTKFAQNYIQLMPSYFPFTTATWCCQDEQLHQSSSRGLSLKLGSPTGACQENHAGESKEQGSSSAQMVQSHQDVAAILGTNSQDQCISSDTAQSKSHKNTVEDQMKSSFFLANPSSVANTSRFDRQPSMAQIPYAYENPYVKGLYGLCGAQAIVQPQLFGIVPARIPLPFELAEEGPIYVNAKQYQGILRRRQVRARLEAQNKLLKNRKPYLHESRHLHAVKRVRGSGGRFLSTKKPPPSSPSTKADCALGLGYVNEQETENYEALTASFTIKHITNNDVFQQSDQRFTNSFTW